jgi:NAD(P) transhydrogenase subunit alpha
MAESQQLLDQAADLATRAGELAQQAESLAAEIARQSGGAEVAGTPFVFLLTVFVLACFVGYYVVWRVTPALHSPLMAVTNAISSVIIVGAIITAGLQSVGFSSWMGFAAVILASVNIFGGFIVTQRMLAMYKKKQK